MMEKRKELMEVCKDMDEKIGKREEKYHQSIIMNVSKWLELTDISLDKYNDGTQLTLEHYLVPHDNPASDCLEVIIKVNFHNMKSISGYETTISEINLQSNSGWSSKGSKVTYMYLP